MEYLGEMLIDGRCLDLFRKTNDGDCEKFDLDKGAWVNSVDALDAFNGYYDGHLSRVGKAEAEKIIAEWKKNYEKRLKQQR